MTMQQRRKSKLNGDRSPQRQALHEAIGVASQAQVDLDKAEAALEAARRKGWAAQTRLELAEKQLAQARDLAGEAVMESLLAGTEPDGDAIMRDHRLLHQQAADSVEVCRSAVNRLSSLIPERQKALLVANREVQKSAHMVIKSECPDLRHQLEHTIQRLRELRSITHWLFRHSCCEDQELRDWWQGHVGLLDLNQNGPTYDLLRLAGADQDIDAGHPMWQQWESALSELGSNADAELPNIGGEKTREQWLRRSTDEHLRATWAQVLFG
jgi:hypothetical protein